MNAFAEAVVESGGKVRHLTGKPPLVLRQVRSPWPDVACLCLVGGAAGPLAGDDLHLSLEVERGAHVHLEATGASIAQGCAPAEPGRLSTRVQVAARGSLVASPPPLISCDGSSTEVFVEAELEADAALDWSELLVFGRSGEDAGGVLLTWHVTIDGRPLLRQSIDLRDAAMFAWPGMIRRQRVVATRLVVGDSHGESPLVPRTIVRSPFAVAQELDHRAVLLTVLASDAVTAGFELGELARSVRPECSG